VNVLVVSDEQLAARVRQTLATAPDLAFGGQCSTVLDARSRLAEDVPDIVLLDLRLPDSLAFLEWLARLSPTPAAIALLSEGQMELLQQALLAGVCAFSLVPIVDEDLLSTLRYGSNVVQQRRGQQESAESRATAAANDDEMPEGQMLAISGTKGGVGRSVIAVNLAVALAEQVPGRVALVEGCASLGDIDLMLNTQPHHALADLVSAPGQLDADLIRGALVKHVSGLDVLFAATRGNGENACPTSGLLAAALRQLRAVRRFVVVDTSAETSATLAEVLSAASLVLLVSTPELPALRQASAFVQEARDAEFPSERLRLVLNREGMPGSIGNASIVERLELPIALALPDDPALVAYSINRGVPLVQSHPKSLLARRLREYASEIISDSQEAAVRPDEKIPEQRGGSRLARTLRLKEAPW
jgi:pilus assembly protein CpaE